MKGVGQLAGQNKHFIELEDEEKVKEDHRKAKRNEESQGKKLGNNLEPGQDTLQHFEANVLALTVAVEPQDHRRTALGLLGEMHRNMRLDN